MDIMCSAVTEKGIVTFDLLGVDRLGRSIYRISLWDGKQWSYAKYRSFKAARKTWRLLCRMLEQVGKGV